MVLSPMMAAKWYEDNMGKTASSAREVNNEEDNVLSSMSGGVIPEAPAPAPKPASSGKGLDIELTEVTAGEPKKPAAPTKRPSLEPMMSDSGASHKPAAQHSSREMKPRYPAPEGVTPRRPRTEPMQGDKK